MWISKKIIDLHGGRLEATSDGEGHGTSMTYVLPLFKLKPEEKSEPESSRPHSYRMSHAAPEDIEESFHGELKAFRTLNVHSIATSSDSNSADLHDGRSLESVNILVADDSLICRKIVERVLVAAGATCVLCADGVEVVNKIKSFENYPEENRVHMILLDYEVTSCSLICQTLWIVMLI